MEEMQSIIGGSISGIADVLQNTDIEERAEELANSFNGIAKD